ncbi:NAD(P)/FAD-dependent oxidoreductase [Teredinibacter sp. KSP-S5-2]|uniref:NAD(P)/FAD-dependent oxidoreductase n=1 Tax=Teredinibacter sp. KSP-S5-2 TaxID=3034506 RepID=UPI002934BE81|nr:NAD(P)/FAD-dependent oxidoreductase [Teredinibacter sp. KSP-S5-2]WNO09249.1 NAD(P)/FAD-dependent oxidoreductase [Teredinibacter sp. KSP-S5-2]
MNSVPSHADVLIIGAGPSGSIASAILHSKGHSVVVMEKQTFPRFSIGESLLPHCMEFVEEAGMLEAVNNYGFQFKNGAAFRKAGKYGFFDFREKFSEGPGTTFQVERGTFDKLLADEAEKQGVAIFYEYTITAVEFKEEQALVSYTDAAGNESTITTKFVLDASGFGRVLPRLLDLERPSDFPVRKSIFTHIDDHISDENYDRNKILVTVHPEEDDIWFWLIPFSDGRCSLGVVAREDQINSRKEDTIEKHIQRFVDEAPELKALLAKAEYNYPAREIIGYSADVTSLYGKNFALLGNAGEFLDPVFSSGVTIAMRSASMAANILHRQLSGDDVDWETEYSVPLKKGVNTFRTFVESWYDCRLQDVIFYKDKKKEVSDMICSILAGYAWDEKNPYVKEPNRRMNVLAEICRMGIA